MGIKRNYHASFKLAVISSGHVLINISPIRFLQVIAWDILLCYILTFSGFDNMREEIKILPNGKFSFHDH